ncbi:hypothetical protein, partial [Lysinibacillus sphaericus]|uniref:hypothetical protein n=1 Tax=Lysinibacillus sphaericus TaxID=1421 RepID=UPI001E4EFCEB
SKVDRYDRLQPSPSLRSVRVLPLVLFPQEPPPSLRTTIETLLFQLNLFIILGIKKGHLLKKFKYLYKN